MEFRNYIFSLIAMRSGFNEDDGGKVLANWLFSNGLWVTSSPPLLVLLLSESGAGRILLIEE